MSDLLHKKPNRQQNGSKKQQIGDIEIFSGVKK